MRPTTLELQPVTVEDIESWAMTPEVTRERSQNFLQAKLAQLALSADADDFDFES